jgi:hypothetical protein
MTLGWKEIKDRALSFSKKWEGETRERAESQSFWNDFFKVFGISRRRVASFEEPIRRLDDTYGFIDLFWKGTILIEQKSKNKSLDTAYTQALEYFDGLTENELPKYVLVSNFAHFRLYDLDDNTQHEFELKDLVNNVHLFGFIAGYQVKKIRDQDPVNIEAAYHMGKLHDKLKENGYSGHSLEVYLVRLLFCMFADNTGIFEKDIFLEYIENKTNEDGTDIGLYLNGLFEVLDKAENDRQLTLNEDLRHFPYINGRLFEERLDNASFDSEMRQILIDSCRLDWSKISPAIFGSLFQSVMDPEERRNLGAHYTSEVNILKLINPLFMDELWIEFKKIKKNPNKLNEFHEKLANLKFLDPACGCGNFLVITYRELRLLELEILKVLLTHTDGDKQQVMDISRASKIDVDAFYGIEVEEFPSRIAEVSMWMMDHQMNMKISDDFGFYYARLPLNKSANICIENALRKDWDSILSNDHFSYILGNPPFVGKQYQDSLQKEDMKLIFKDVKGAGVLDYVTAWYIKAAEYIENTDIKVAFVSTNSISQGEQVGILWNQLYNNYGIKIHFAHRTFKWINEARGNAGVYVVIIGFANYDIKEKLLYEYSSNISEAHEIKVKNINPYLVEGEDKVIIKRRKPICDVPRISFGSMPNDGGNLLLNDDEKNALLSIEPKVEKYIRPLISASTFINGNNRWCLWLVDASPNELRNMPEVMNRINLVQKVRTQSTRVTTQNLADTPALFGENRQPKTDFILIPLHSSEHRKYIPMSLLDKNNIANNSCSVVATDDIYYFGVLTSIMHMTWVNYVCGRIKGDFRYSNEIVYNNFPWPENPNRINIVRVKSKAQKVIEIRKEFSDSSLADLYDRLTMPSKLVKAHNDLDKAVDLCYGINSFENERKRIEFLFDLHGNITFN